MLPVTRNVMAGTRSSLMMVARRQQHTITPTALAGIESRWTKLPECEQGAISDYLAERQKGDWKNLTLEEKRAGELRTLILVEIAQAFPSR
ncbi:hypothetical protein BC832DRAFT_543860 [Gaertneriomyces semiglobifer]|nr:hypothetical protein BC832DRAFT_543860 [Gaertneriomyces semiglobifer]